MAEERNVKFLNTHSEWLQYCQNSTNSIEDPIFTGFTMSIDTLHSPLFYSILNKDVIETLRGDGTNTELADAWEKALNYMYRYRVQASPDQYELATLNAKDMLVDRQAGYGLQDRYYMDNILYGAADYIYMVDKVSLGTYSDDIGVTDIGNGTPTTSIEKRQSNKLAEVENDLSVQAATASMADFEVVETEDSDGMPNIEIVSTPKYDYNSEGKIDAKIDLINDSITDEDRQKHAENEKAVNDTKKEYEAKLNEYNKKVKELDDFKKEIDNQKSEIQSKLANFKTTMEKNQALLKTTDADSQPNAEQEITDTYHEYLKFLIPYLEDYEINELVSKNPEMTDEFSGDNGEEDEAKKASLKENKYPNVLLELSIVYKDDTNKFTKEWNEIPSDVQTTNTGELFKKAFAVMKSAISRIGTSEDAKEKLKSLNQEVEALTRKVYGVHPDGRLGSESDPAEGSLCYKYVKAEEELRNDSVTVKEQEIAELRDIKSNLSDIREYEKVNEEVGKTEITNNLPSVDYEHPENNKRELYEVPQTAYDMLGFIKGMRDVTTKYPYVLQTVSGLEEAYKQYFLLKDPYMGSGEGKITINCLEFLDLRVSSMLNKYFNAVYDRQYKRERVPINLRRFNCSIFVHDIRNFKNAIGQKVNFVTGENNHSTDIFGDLYENIVSILNIARNHVSAVEFKFYDCEIVPEETGNIFDSVSNVEAGEMKKTNLTFTYGNCVINFLPFEDLEKYVIGPVSSNKDGEDKRISHTVQRNKDLADEKAKVLSSEIRLKKSKVTNNTNEGNDFLYDTEVGNVTVDRTRVISDRIDKIAEETVTKDLKYDENGILISNNWQEVDAIRNDRDYTKNPNTGNPILDKEIRDSYVADDGNFRRWFDRSEIGNVNNNDYREYVRVDSTVAVDDYYKTTVVNNFALGSVAQKNKELAQMDEALRKIITGISASTGIPVKGVADALNIGNIDGIINERDLASGAQVKNLGNVNTSKIISTDKTEYVGKVIGDEEPGPKTITDLGNINKKTTEP